MRIWSRLFDKKNHMLKDTVITVEDISLNRTKKVFQALEDTCYEFDLGKPIWLDSTIADFQKHSKCRFYQDSFIEEIDFHYLEFQVLEED